MEHVAHGRGGGGDAGPHERPRALHYVGPRVVEAAIRAAGHPSAALVSLALHGPRGSGKATAATDIVEAMYGPDPEEQSEHVLRVEGGAGVGIDFAREELGRFARRVRRPDGLPRTLILRRASAALQAALRQAIEDHADTLRVIFVVDLFEDVNPAIRSRCLPVAIPPHTVDSFAALLPAGVDARDALARSRGNLTVALTLPPAPRPRGDLPEAVAQLLGDPARRGVPAAWRDLRADHAVRAADVADAFALAVTQSPAGERVPLEPLVAGLWALQRAEAGLAWSSASVADAAFAGLAAGLVGERPADDIR